MVYERFFSKELQRNFWLDVSLLKFTWDDPVELKQTIHEINHRNTDQNSKSHSQTTETSGSFDDCIPNPIDSHGSSANEISFSHEKLNPSMTEKPQRNINNKNHKYDNKISKEENSIAFSSSTNKTIEHSVFLYLNNTADRIKCKKFVNDCLCGRTYVLNNIIIVCMMVSRIKLTFQLSIWHSISSLFYIFFIFLLILLNIGTRLSMFTERKLPTHIQNIFNFLIDDIFHDELESMMLVAFTLGSVSSTISRVLYGACPENASPMASITFCNQLSQSNSPPLDGVFWTFNGLVTFLLFLKNSRKIIVFLMWLLASVTVIWSVLYLRSWSQSWLFGTCIVYAFFFYEIERTQMVAFIKSEETLDEQEKRHQIKVKHDLEIAELKVTHETNLRKFETDQMRALIGNVAHDLKTPIHCVKNEIESLRQTLVEATSRFPEFQVKILENADTNPIIALEDVCAICDFMTISISRFQDFTKSGMGVALTPIIVTFSVSHSLQFARRLMKYQLHKGEENRIVISPVSEEICDNIMSEKHWFQENVVCLLSNALKYSNRGTPVMIKLELVSEDALPKFDLWKCHNNEDIYESKNINDTATKNRDAVLKLNQVNTRQMILVSVIDGGVGIPKEKLQDLFQPFKQTQRMTGGTGLGLYSLSKRMEALKGFCGVEPRSDGLNGSVFWFAFPYRADYTDYSVVSSPFDTISKAPSKFPYRILVVDDTVSILKFTANQLRAKGHYVEVIDNGTEALERLKDGFSTQDFDVLLTDIQMPTMDGFELVRQYREFEKHEMQNLKTDLKKLRNCSNREGKLLIMCMSANQNCKEVALDVGIDHFMEKPFRINSYLEVLETVMVAHHGGHGSSSPVLLTNEI